VQGRKFLPLKLVPDSSAYAYAGYTSDLKEVFDALQVRHLDSAGGNNWSLVAPSGYRPVLHPETVRNNTMPDVRNMTLKDAIYLLENMNVKVNVRGRGKVVAQDLLPGSALGKNQTVTLLLNE